MDEQCADENELECGRDELQNAHAYDEIDAARAALDYAAQTAGAALKMKSQRQPVQVPEGAIIEFAHRVLADARKEDVADLVQRHHQHARRSVGDDEHGCANGEALRSGGLATRYTLMRCKPVGRLLEQHRHGDRDQLRQHQHAEGQDYPQPQVGTAFGPNHRQQTVQHGPMVRGRGQYERGRSWAGMRAAAAAEMFG